MNETMRRIWFWIFPLLIAATIVALSAQSQLPGGISLPHPYDWFAHATAFGSLALALEAAFRAVRHDLPLYRRHLWILLIVALFAASDEWHQRFVPGRQCDVFDWMADVSGCVVALGLACLPLLYGRRLAALSWWKGSRERPDPSRPLILVADPHWNEELVGLREATLAHPGADWLFLGDIFDVWVGLSGMQTEAQRSFLWWVRERRNAGRWVGLWMGNRDYFLDSLAGLFDLMGEGTGGGLPGEELAFEHGDLINGADHGYRFWNLVSRSGLTRLVAFVLPAPATRWLSRRLERSLRTTNAKYKLVFPREAFHQAAAEHPGTTFMTGHFHTHEVEGNGLALPWAHEGAFAKWHQGLVGILPAPVTKPPLTRT
jgi:VanZ family protein/UDP-2,3-diacylglucosamine pyrophosphatase LpxH